jgi:hypothetical protein
MIKLIDPRKLLFHMISQSYIAIWICGSDKCKISTKQSIPATAGLRCAGIRDMYIELHNLEKHHHGLGFHAEGSHKVAHTSTGSSSE